MKTANKNSIAIGMDAKVIILIVLTVVLLWGATTLLNKNSETAVNTPAQAAIIPELKIWKATGEAGSVVDITSNPGLAGIELSEGSIKNVGANMAIVQMGAISELLAPGEAMGINSATKAIYVAHPREEYIGPDGHGGYFFDFFNKRPKNFPLY
ncbi:hypothetical protein KKB43_01845 [Patescibacteria group bacterium]|nr:hypothetical protein [Patescibacteria group bacterium]